MRFPSTPLLSLFATICITGTLVAEPIHILPIGDSITQGGKKDREEYTYRWPLFKMLVDAGVDFDFVGARKDGLQPEAKWPAEYKGKPFDPDHEGIYGAKTAYVLDKLKTDIATFPPADIALIHLGTNDQKSKDFQADIITPLKDMVTLLRERNPHVVVLIGQLAFNGGTAIQIRPEVEKTCKEISTAQSPVIAVNHFEGWKEKPGTPDADTFDWAHPNPQGQEKMAAKWFAAMKPYLKK